MKFKFMGMKMNTLYVILILLVVLGIVYLCMHLTEQGKEGFIDTSNFQTSLGIVLNLVGDDFYKLPSDQEVKDAVGKSYPPRFDNAIRYAVYALFKAATGAILLGDKMNAANTEVNEQVSKGRSMVDGLSSSQVNEMLEQIRGDCQGAIEIQPLLNNIIETLSTSEENVCGDSFKSSVRYEEFTSSIDIVKQCKAKIEEMIAGQPQLNIFRDVADFSLELVTEVLKYLELLDAELIILADCETAAAEGALAEKGCPTIIINPATGERTITNQPNANARATNRSLPSDYNTAYTSSLTSNTQPSNLSKGIPKNMIPAGQEDLYILKSEVVPPVCPACPDPVLMCEGNGKKDCPPCPPCGRCPEPSFECKKVPNYGTGNLGANYNNYGAGFGRMMGPSGDTTNFLPYPAAPRETTMYGA